MCIDTMISFHLCSRPHVALRMILQCPDLFLMFNYRKYWMTSDKAASVRKFGWTPCSVLSSDDTLHVAQESDFKAWGTPSFSASHCRLFPDVNLLVQEQALSLLLSLVKAFWTMSWTTVFDRKSIFEHCRSRLHIPICARRRSVL